MRLSIFFFALCLFLCLKAEQEVGPVQNYPDDKGNVFSFPKPKWSSVITNVPDTYGQFFKEATSPEAYPYLAGIVGSSLLLYYYDRKIINEVQRWGRAVGLGNGDATKPMIRVKKYAILRGPTDVGSAFYFIGDGWTHATIMASFFTYGKIGDSFRAEATSAAIAHGLIVSTISNQFLKRTTGRESPYRALDTERGHWILLPNQGKYNKDVSKYDAFPSGHLATFSMTASVILENYPEYGHILRPMFIGLGSLLGLQMLNNAVHWASDYPLAIGMGYLFGKIAARTGKMMTKYNQENKTSFMLYPIMTQDNGGGAGIVYQF